MGITDHAIVVTGNAIGVNIRAIVGTDRTMGSRLRFTSRIR